MTPAVLFTDATALVANQLRTKLSAYRGTPTTVVQKIPAPRPALFVTVIRTGGPRANLVTDGAQITVDSYGNHDELAADLAQAARAFVNAMRGSTVAGHPIYRVDELSGPANLPDPLSNQSRYRQSFIVAIRGAHLEE